MSTAFPLSISSKQGCPLPPALFIIAIEPLAQTIRGESEIKGAKVGKTIHKINLMADNIILYLTSRFDSLAKLQRVLHNFGSISRYKVNYEKSEILPLSNFDCGEYKQRILFKWSPNGIRYLGIVVDNNLKQVYKLNYLTLASQITEDLQKWINLPITLIG